LTARKRLLELCCGAGGGSAGYAEAGFEVVGVDIEPPPSYLFEFHQADALTFPLDGFDAIHASPPCQWATPLKALQTEQAKASYLNLVEPIRFRLKRCGLPYIIENVPQANLKNPVRLCGQMFGLKLYRHRDFETNWYLAQPKHRKHVARCIRAGYLPTSEAPYMSIHGRNGYNSRLWVRAAAEYMGMPWVAEDLNGVCEAIPPAYTRYVGIQLLARIERTYLEAA
jgi:DNA (cytosine-5)-methyltransferase 1